MLVAEADEVVARDAVGVCADLAEAEPERVARSEAAELDGNLGKEVIESAAIHARSVGQGPPMWQTGRSIVLVIATYIYV